MVHALIVLFLILLDILIHCNYGLFIQSWTVPPAHGGGADDQGCTIEAA